MRTRSFIGLIILVALLIVASTPALLDQTASGIEKVGQKWDLLEDEQAAYEAELRRDSKSRKDDDAEPSEPQLMLKGHVLDTETGDLRDTATATERAANQRGRLAAGDQRVLLPGQLTDQDAYSLPPVTSEDGMLLDATGCPVFTTTAELEAVSTDAMESRLDKADDRNGCEAKLFAQWLNGFATGGSNGTAEVRQRRSAARGSVNGMIVAAMQIDLLQQMIDTQDLEYAISALDDSAVSPPVTGDEVQSLFDVLEAAAGDAAGE